jgi:Tol biopolymer transport system component
VLESNRDGQFNIYKQEIDRDTANRITFGPGGHIIPHISPDGRSLLYLWFNKDAEHFRSAWLMIMPLAGGTAREILTANSSAEFHCSRTAGAGCVLNEHRGNVVIASLFDPTKGRGPKIIEAPGLGNAAISPDGQHIAFVLSGTPRNRIRLTDLHGATEREITVSGVQNLQSLDWSADGSGFFSGDAQSDSTRLLHIDRNGGSQILWTQPGLNELWGISSPDGRYLATLKYDVSANVVGREPVSASHPVARRPFLRMSNGSCIRN